MNHITLPEVAEQMIQNLMGDMRRQDGSGHPLRSEAELRGLIASLYQDIEHNRNLAAKEGRAHSRALDKLADIKRDRNLIDKARLATEKIADYFATKYRDLQAANEALQVAAIKLIRTLDKAHEIVMPRLRGACLVTARKNALGRIVCGECSGRGRVIGDFAESMIACPKCSPLLAATPKAAAVKKTPTTLGFVDAAPITLRQFQVANERRVPAFGASLQQRSLMEWCCELAEEAGEVCGVAKKLARASHPTDPTKDITGKPRKKMSDLADEIGDVVTVAAIVASRAGIDFEQAVKVKWNKVSEGVNWKERL